MSRTKKGTRPVGFEYWSKRPLSGSAPGKVTKKLTHRKERMQDKKVEHVAVKTECREEAGDD